MAAPPTLVVGVGASAGGLEAFKRLLSKMPSDSGMAFVLVQHLDPTHECLLCELLAPRTAMSVCDADQDTELAPDTVYVIRRDTALAISGGKIELSAPNLHRGVRLPVDHLFRSLARNNGPRAVGIVLSGAGSDGSAGVRAIRSAGGLVIDQGPGTCGQSGMPQSAIDTEPSTSCCRSRTCPKPWRGSSGCRPERGSIPPRKTPSAACPPKASTRREVSRLDSVLEAT